MPTQSLSEIVVALEKAIALANSKKSAVDQIRKQIADAEASYTSAVESVQKLSTEYNTLLAQTMNSYGLNPIAQSYGQVHK